MRGIVEVFNGQVLQVVEQMLHKISPCDLDEQDKRIALPAFWVHGRMAIIHEESGNQLMSLQTYYNCSYTSNITVDSIKIKEGRRFALP